MPTRTSSNGQSRLALLAGGRRYLALAALGLATAAAVGCKGRERVRTVDADLGHDLDLASTTGIELANRGGAAMQVVSAIEETPRTAPRSSASRTPRSAGKRRHKVAKPTVDAPPATVMVADHEMVASASTEQAAGPEPTATAPAQSPDPGPAITPAPEPYPAGGGTEAGRGDGGGGGGIIGVIGVVLRGGMGGVDRCDERDGHGRHGRRGGGGPVIGIPVPGGGVWGGTVLGGGGGSRTGGGTRWPARGGTTFPR